MKEAACSSCPSFLSHFDGKASHLDKKAFSRANLSPNHNDTFSMPFLLNKICNNNGKSSHYITAVKSERQTDFNFDIFRAAWQPLVRRQTFRRLQRPKSSFERIKGGLTVVTWRTFWWYFSAQLKLSRVIWWPVNRRRLTVMVASSAPFIWGGTDLFYLGFGPPPNGLRWHKDHCTKTRKKAWLFEGLSRKMFDLPPWWCDVCCFKKGFFSWKETCCWWYYSSVDAEEVSGVRVRPFGLLEEELCEGLDRQAFAAFLAKAIATVVVLLY